MFSAEQRAFLDGVTSFNGRFNSVRAGKSTLRLVHPFWSAEEILKAPTLQNDWQVPPHFAPFYGDWHTLICLDTKTGAVVLLDDERSVEHAWNSVKDFTSSLTNVESPPSQGDSGIVEAWFED